MCGIIGYTGKEQAQPLLLRGLQALQSRGFDSAGVAIEAPEQVTGSLANIVVVKVSSPPALETLTERLTTKPLSGTTGIGHVRWATRGELSEQNAHPHTDLTGQFQLVHNGNVQNVTDLQAVFQPGTQTLASETDSAVLVEWLAQLAQRRDCDTNLPHISRANDLLLTIAKALRNIEGMNAFALMSTETPHSIFAACIGGGELYIGFGDTSTAVASSIDALRGMATQAFRLLNGEVFEVQPCLLQGLNGLVTRESLANRLVPVPELTATDKTVRSAGYWMAREMSEVPEVVRRIIVTTANWCMTDDCPVNISQTSEVVLLGCGSAFHACELAASAFPLLTGLRTSALLASNTDASAQLDNLPEGRLVVAVTQSGTTADTLKLLRRAGGHGPNTIAVHNAPGSTVTYEAGMAVDIQAGKEESVASTKAFIGQCVMLLFTACIIGKRRSPTQANAITTRWQAEHLTTQLAERLAEVLARETASGQLAKIATSLKRTPSLLLLAQGVDLPIAHEGALKLIEVAQLPTLAMAAGEIKHGPLAMVPDAVCIALVPHCLPSTPEETERYQRLRGTVADVRSRKGRVIVMTTDVNHDFDSLGDDAIQLPNCGDPITQAIIQALALQLLAYHVGMARDLNPDRPRNLAKTVTVE